MLYKPRTESSELLILKLLNSRMNLSDKDKQHYFNLRKGYDGEGIFDCLTEKLQCECLILNDLLLKLNHTTFQIDSLIITSELIYLFEVKNYQGDFFYESDRLYKKNKTEINDPLIQLRRSESLFRQLLQTLGYNLPIIASVVFINPAFTLYQSPLSVPFIFPTQVNGFMNKLNFTPSQLDKKHLILADKLLSLHSKESPYTQLPSYDYDQLHKGIICAECGSLSLITMGMNVECIKCGHTEVASAAVMRSVEEFKLLFPNRKITTSAIYAWCSVVQSKKRIKRILDQNFTITGTLRWSFYQ